MTHTPKTLVCRSLATLITATLTLGSGPIGWAENLPEAGIETVTEAPAVDTEPTPESDVELEIFDEPQPADLGDAEMDPGSDESLNNDVDLDIIAGLSESDGLSEGHGLSEGDGLSEGNAAQPDNEPGGFEEYPIEVEVGEIEYGKFEPSETPEQIPLVEITADSPGIDGITALSDQADDVAVLPTVELQVRCGSSDQGWVSIQSGATLIMCAQVSGSNGEPSGGMSYYAAKLDTTTGQYGERTLITDAPWISAMVGWPPQDGQYQVVAEYSGDSVYAAAASEPVIVVVGLGALWEPPFTGNPATIVYPDDGVSILQVDPVFTNSGALFPGLALSPGVSNNSVTVNSTPTAISNVIGGIAENYPVVSAEFNSVTINGGVVTEGVYGGIGNGLNPAGHNSVIVTGGSVPNVFGGLSAVVAATDNRVEIAGGVVTGEIFGGSGSLGATGNTVIVAGGTITETVYGGHSQNGDQFSGNTLHKLAETSLSQIRSFEYVNFGYSGQASIGELATAPQGVGLNRVLPVKINTGANEIVFAGNIVDGKFNGHTGNGGIEKLGTGRLIITGETTLTDGIIISEGTLQVGNGGYLGNVGNDITVNNATLAFNRADTYQSSGIISGVGSLEFSLAARIGDVLVESAQPVGLHQFDIVISDVAGGWEIGDRVTLINNVTGIPRNKTVVHGGKYFSLVIESGALIAQVVAAPEPVRPQPSPAPVPAPAPTPTPTVRPTSKPATPSQKPGTTFQVLSHFDTYTGIETIAARIDADHTTFTGLWLGGQEVDPADYTITAGSTIITLANSHLEKLPNKTHYYIAEFSNGTSEPIRLMVNVPQVPAPVGLAQPFEPTTLTATLPAVPQAAQVVGARPGRLTSTGIAMPVFMTFGVGGLLATGLRMLRLSGRRKV